MIIRRLSETEGVEWGNGLSHRFLTLKDGMGYTVTHTIVRAGSGKVIDSAGDEHAIEAGTLYALDKHDPHHLIASPDQDMVLVCMFTPALIGDETHNLDDEYSYYY